MKLVSPSIFSRFPVFGGPCIKMEEEQKKKKRDKLKAAFKVSRTKVRLWEDKFQGEQGRKPTKEERKQAPENVTVALKNIWKIQAYFDQEEKDRKLAKQRKDGKDQGNDSEPGVFLEDVKENLTGEGHLTTSGASSDISSKVATRLTSHSRLKQIIPREMAALLLELARISPIFLHQTLTPPAHPFLVIN